MERVQAIGIFKSQDSIGLNNFSAADWDGKCIDITKKTWIRAYMKFEEHDPVVTCFGQLDNTCISPELEDGKLPSQVKDLEKFVCQVYSSIGEINLPALGWEMFQSRNMEGMMLPPTRAALLPHVTRVNYTAMRDKSYVTHFPNLPAIETSGW